MQVSLAFAVHAHMEALWLASHTYMWSSLTLNAHARSLLVTAHFFRCTFSVYVPLTPAHRSKRVFAMAVCGYCLLVLHDSGAVQLDGLSYAALI